MTLAAPGAPSTQPVKPSGSPLLSVPDQVRYSDADRRALAEAWNRAMPGYRGLLNAQHSGG